MKTFLIVYQYDDDVFKVIRDRENKAEALKRFKDENPCYKVIAIRELHPTLKNLYL
mgnify:CR=1 FL=1